MNQIRMVSTRGPGIENGYKREQIGRQVWVADRVFQSFILSNIDIVTYTKDLLETIQKDMYNKAKERQDKLTFEAHNLEDMEKILNTQPGFIHAMWCGDVECENKIKEIKGCKSRCILEDEKAIDDKCVCCGKPAKHHVIWGIQYQL